MAAKDTTYEIQHQIVFESMLYGEGTAPNLKDKAPPPALTPVSTEKQKQSRLTNDTTTEENDSWQDVAAPMEAVETAPATPPAARPVRVMKEQQQTGPQGTDYTKAQPSEEIRVASKQTRANMPASAPVPAGGDVVRRAKAGDPDAEYQVGMMYTQDRPGGMSTNASSQSYYWLTQAASKGHPRAQYNLGVMYAQGEGIVQNLVEAYIWFNLAAAQRMDGALEAREMIARSLTPAALMKAQERSTLYYQKITDNQTKMQQQGPAAVVPIR